MMTGLVNKRKDSWRQIFWTCRHDGPAPVLAFSKTGQSGGSLCNSTPFIQYTNMVKFVLKSTFVVRLRAANESHHLS